jgi:hypothetical protein
MARFGAPAARDSADPTIDDLDARAERVSFCVVVGD